MRKTTANLVPGDIMRSGEIVVSVRKSTPFGQTSPKGSIILLNPKTNKKRIASWNWWGDVFLKQSVE